MTYTDSDLVLHRIPLADLSPHPMNPRRGNVAMLVESLQENRQYAPIVVNKGSKTGRRDEILAGHHLVLAAAELGWPDIKAVYVDEDEEGARRILLADNRSSDLAGYDDRLLAELLSSLERLDGTGFTEEDLASLIKVLDLPDIEVPDNDQDILDKSDEAMWPEIRGRVAPSLYATFLLLPGEDDAGKLSQLLQDRS